jgi:hypothetical protein
MQPAGAHTIQVLRHDSSENIAAGKTDEALKPARMRAGGRISNQMRLNFRAHAARYNSINQIPKSRKPRTPARYRAKRVNIRSRQASQASESCLRTFRNGN